MGGKRKARTTRSSRTRRVVGTAPVHLPPDLLFASAMKSLKVGDTNGAEMALRKMLANDAGDLRAAQHLGALLGEADRIDEAIDVFEEALPAAGPVTVDNLAFYNNYANALRRADRLVAAEELLREMVTLAPGEWQPWHNLAQVLKESKRYDEAAAAIRRAVLLEPEWGPNHGVLGEVLHRLGRLNSAAASLQRCIDLGSDTDGQLWTTIGANQRHLGQLDEALVSLERAISLTGSTAASHSNLGVVLMQMGRFDESIEHFRRTLELEPDNAMYHGYMAYALLTAGRLEESWDDWEYGIDDGPRGKERNTGVPRWTPDEPDVRVLTYREQGVGDEIMFASCYPDLIEAAREVVIETDPRVVELFARSFPGAEVRAQTFEASGKETMHDFERVIPAGSLYRYFRPSLEHFPDRRAYLVPDPGRVAAWKDRLHEFGHGPYVGISWRSKIKTAERRLEYTRIEDWGPIFAIKGATWVNLQYDKCESELLDAESRFGVRIARWSWLDLMNDFEDVAALISALDLVVAPHNAVAMLGGALGIRTIATGNAFGWAQLGTDSYPWMPSLELAHRQPGETWDGPIATAARAVAETVERAQTHV